LFLELRNQFFWFFSELRNHFFWFFGGVKILKFSDEDHIFLELRNQFFWFFLELRNHFFWVFLGVQILKFSDEDPGSGIPDGDSLDPDSRIRESGEGKKSDPRSGINIPDPQHGRLPK
jgi:hypothetical protein